MPQADPASSGIVLVPPSVRDAHPELVELILASESMNDGERQYWIDILPAMKPEQIDQLRSILAKEREQLASIDEKYGQQLDDIARQKMPLEEMEAAAQARAVERAKQEQAAAAEAEESADTILQKIEDL